jgi:YesN/AraC family two-component response regulator
MIYRAAVTMMDLPKDGHVGVYNVFRDPMVREMGILDQVRQVLDGKTLTFTDVVTPYQDMVRRFHAMDSDIRTIHVDITCFPVFRSDGAVGCFVTVFLIKNAYRGKDGISCGKAYIEAHWREKFDAESVARAANLSVHHFSRLFKKHMGQTPHEYYTAVRVRRLQERLRDESLTVSEAFAA